MTYDSKSNRSPFSSGTLIALAFALTFAVVFTQATAEASQQKGNGTIQCCAVDDPVDSNFCFDSWEEFEQACRESTGPDDAGEEFPPRSEDEFSDLF